MTTNTPSAAHLIRRSQIQNLVLAGLSGGLALILIYLTLVRPFTAGFDLITVRNDAGRPAAQLINAQGESVQNQLSGVTALILDGTYRDGTAFIEAVEQIVGENQPQVFGVEIRGRDQDTLVIGQMGRDSDNQSYVISDGFSGSLAGEGLTTETLNLDPDQGIFQTSGPTTVTQGGGTLQAETGVRFTRDGNLEIGGQ